jgi:23S rRNA pseudouridine1911/1915/1917 synthase
MSNFCFIVKNIEKLKINTVREYLLSQNLSVKQIKKLSKSLGQIMVNDKPVFSNFKLHNEDKINIMLNEKCNTTYSIYINNNTLNILYEDNYLLIINKPINVPTIPTSAHINDSLLGSVVNYLKDNNFVYRVIGRLDKETSGIIIICKDSITYSILKSAKIDKYYKAIVYGKLRKSKIIKKPILTKVENGINIEKRIISSKGKISITKIINYKNFNNNTSLLTIKLLTGRTHQIRLHLSSINHPILGDKLYGNINTFNYDRLALQCFKVVFIHPITGQKMVINCKIDDSMNSMLYKV